MEGARRFHDGGGSKGSNSRGGSIRRKVMAMMIRNAVVPFVAYRWWRPADDATYQRGLATGPVVVQPIDKRPASLGWRPSSIVDLHCGGPGGPKEHNWGQRRGMDGSPDGFGWVWAAESPASALRRCAFKVSTCRRV